MGKAGESAQQQSQEQGLAGFHVNSLENEVEGEAVNLGPGLIELMNGICQKLIAHPTADFFHLGLERETRCNVPAGADRHRLASGIGAEVAGKIAIALRRKLGIGGVWHQVAEAIAGGQIECFAVEGAVLFATGVPPTPDMLGHGKQIAVVVSNAGAEEVVVSFEKGVPHSDDFGVSHMGITEPSSPVAALECQVRRVEAVALLIS